MTRQKFGEAYERGYQGTIRFLQKSGVDQDLANEIAQAAWAKACERISDLRNEAAITTWVNVIARNILRSSLRRKRPVDISEMKHEPAAPPSIDLLLIDVRNALQKCKLHERQIVERFLEGYSCLELALQSGRSLAAVHAEMYRARQALREHMQLTRCQFLPGEGVLRMKAQREDSARSKASGELLSVEREAIKRAS